jgi:microsomal dipeptidase-like Zn-dependent dipeptidase
LLPDARSRPRQQPDHYHGIKARGRELVRRMKELGILIDIRHGTEAVHLQLIEANPYQWLPATTSSVPSVGLGCPMRC